MKFCNTCKQNKNNSEFYLKDNSILGLMSQCKKCLLTKQRKQKKLKPFGYQKANWKLVGIVNPDKTIFTDLNYIKLLKVQEEKCAICKKHQSRLKKSLVVDHDHKTGIVRGLLCIKCNSALGFLNDSPAALRRALKYLGYSVNYPTKKV